MDLFIQTKDYVILIFSLVSGVSICERAMMPLKHALSGCDTNGLMFGKGKVLFYKAVQQTNTAADLGRLCTEMENGIDEALINETIYIATKIVGYMYLRKDV